MVPQVTALLAGYLSGYRIAPAMDEAEVRHWLAFQVPWGLQGRAGAVLHCAAPNTGLAVCVWLAVAVCPIHALCVWPARFPP